MMAFFFTLETSGLSSRSEEHTSELQSQSNLVCRLLLEKKKKLDPLVTYASKSNAVRLFYGAARSMAVLWKLVFFFHRGHPPTVDLCPGAVGTSTACIV